MFVFSLATCTFRTPAALRARTVHTANARHRAFLRGWMCLVLWCVSTSNAAAADGLLPTLSEAQAQEARRILDGFKANPRGPFYRIQWYCNDGSVHPPSPPPCQPLGGGYQHASLSPEAKRLEGLGLDVGVILAGADKSYLIDAARDHHRLKQLVLERYLEQVDNGWIYRRAYSYRGARQIEDEEQAGRSLLAELFADPDWLKRRYFLANQLVAVIPHGQPSGTVTRIRNLAKTIADEDGRFQGLRAKIHSAPGKEDLGAVELFLAERNPAAPVAANLRELIDLLRQQYSAAAAKELAEAIRTGLQGTPLEEQGAFFAEAVAANNQRAILSEGATLTLALFDAAAASDAGGARALRYLDINANVQEAGFTAASGPAPTTRKEALLHLRDQLRYAAGAGLLSRRQLAALEMEMDGLLGVTEVAPETYATSVRYLARATEWSRATAGREFGPLSRLYAPAAPPAAGLLDSLLRASPALPLAHSMERIVDDANRAVDLRHRIFERDSSAGVGGLNPGVAIGRLELLEPASAASFVFDPRAIYVVPQTVSDLKPMAGVLTLDSGNALSHAQLLAANLGIPNATVPSSLLPELRRHVGKELFFAVTPRGVVILQEKTAVAPEIIQAWTKDEAAQPERVELDSSRLDLGFRELVPLSALRTADSGVKVGPKAANLGQLSHYFPNRVSPGFVIPFGVYREHIGNAKDASGVSIEDLIFAAFERAEQLRAEGASPAVLQADVYPRLAQIRERIQRIPLDEALAAEIARRVRGDLDAGVAGNPGVFIRSDTNAEDLPGFTGAGLNLTVPNQVGIANILQSIKNVWASPFTERAFEWRSRVFSGAHRVYPSVIVMRSTPSEKSGVIATVNLETGDQSAITVNVSEGVSAVVDGGVAESLLLGAEGEVKLLHQGRASYRKALSPSGGLDNLPPQGDDQLLVPDEIQQVRDIVRQVEQKYPPAYSASGDKLPWDIEFGFVGGQLQLFQIRPLVRYSEMETLGALAALEGESKPLAMVQMDGSL